MWQFTSRGCVFHAAHTWETVDSEQFTWCNLIKHGSPTVSRKASFFRFIPKSKNERTQRTEWTAESTLKTAPRANSSMFRHLCGISTSRARSHEFNHARTRKRTDVSTTCLAKAHKQAKGAHLLAATKNGPLTQKTWSRVLFNKHRWTRGKVNN